MRCVVLIAVLCVGFLGYVVPVHAATIRAAPTNGLVGYWTFDAQNMGTTSARDMSGKNTTGWLIGGVKKVIGRIGQALKFDGSNGHANFGDINATDGQSVLSVFAWVKITEQDGRNSSIVHKQNQSDFNYRWSLSPSQTGIGGDNDLVVLMGNGSNTYGYTDADVLPLNTWTHVGFVFDGSLSGNSNVLKIYVNGVAKTVLFSGTIPATTANTSAPVKVGYYDNPLGGQYFPGSIDDVRIYNRALSYNEVTALYNSRGQAIIKPSAIPSTPIVISNGLVGWWSFDSQTVNGTTIRDVSGTGNTGTRTNGSMAGGKIGNGSVNFGTAQTAYVQMSDNSSLRLTDAFTMSSWVYITSAPSVYYYLVDKQNYYSLIINSSRAARIYLNGPLGGVGPTGGDMTTTDTIPLNTWTHIVSTYDQNGGTNNLKIYINGLLSKQASATGALATSTDVARIGCLANSGDACGVSWGIRGSQDDVRIYNRALSASEIRSLYKMIGKTVNASQTYIPKTTTVDLNSGLVGQWTFDGSKMGTTSALDSSGNDNTGWLISGVKKVIGKIGQALKFDGSTSYATVISTDALSPTSAFAVSMWVKLNSVALSPGLLAKGSGSVVNYGLAINSDQNVQLSFVNGPWRFVNSVTVISPNKWYLLIGTWDGTKLRVYINGVLDGTSGDLSATPPLANAFPLKFGYAENAGSGYVKGIIDDVRVYNRALTATEVRTLYRAGK